MMKPKNSPLSKLSMVYKHSASFTPINLVMEQVEELEKPPEEAVIPPLPSVEEEKAASEAQPGTTPIVQKTETLPEPTGPSISIDVQAVRDEAYQLGFIDAQTEVRAELENTLNTFTDICGKLDVLRSTILLSNREHIINIIMTMCRKIIQLEVSIKRDFIANTLKNAIHRALQSDEFHITVHPDDLEVAERVKPALLSSIRGLKHIELKTDPNIGRGGCLIDSDICTVDASIEGQIDAAMEFLQNNLPEGDAAENPFALSFHEETKS